MVFQAQLKPNALFNPPLDITNANTRRSLKISFTVSSVFALYSQCRNIT